MERIQLILMQNMPHCTLRNSCCRENLKSAGCCVIVYDINMSSSCTLLLPCLVYACYMRGPFLSGYDALFKNTLVKLSSIQMLIIPQCGERISIV
jgi:hypothetical protein